jgi:hypothetical protein
MLSGVTPKLIDDHAMSHMNVGGVNRETCRLSTCS